ncbi:MAG TPA: hypothetical protein VGN97_22685 [Mesorhizobium sp.]|nr:hypothetical protein [Mesorhizobium sp.]
MKALGPAFLWGLGGSIILPIVVFALMVALYRALPECSVVGDSAGCEIFVALVTIAAAPLGFMLFFSVTLIRGLARAWRR